MEKMPYRDELQQAVVLTTETVVSTDWRQGLPTLRGRQVVLRELRASDAASLFALLTTEEVARFISPPPSTVAGFERFIDWGRYCELFAYDEKEERLLLPETDKE